MAICRFADFVYMIDTDIFVCQCRIDALVNNAAISGEYTDTETHAPTTKSPGEQLMDALRTNTVGPAITVAAFADLLAKSNKTPRVINVTSGAGSIALRLNDDNPHQAMKLVCRLPYAFCSISF
jgi:NAD(P)-dependent dehydrogenase (short-subunit alcohol dehydrogenase family)